MTTIGITGSRHGITTPQFQTFRLLTDGLNPDDSGHPPEVHHGDCLGVDKDVADYASARGCTTVSHPPTDSKLRAFHQSTIVLPPAPYLERDRAIVAAVETVYAFPHTFGIDPAAPWQRGEGGTAYTLKHAASEGRPLVIIWPDGTYRNVGATS